MRKDKRNSCEPKGVYRVRNWSEYNAGLIARGSVTMWISESPSTMVSEAEPVMRGRRHVYSDALIQALLTLKQVYHLTLRAALGFAQSLRELAFADLPVPNYDRRKSLWDTTVSRRAQDLRVALPAASSGEPLIWSWTARALSSTEKRMEGAQARLIVCGRATSVRKRPRWQSASAS
jgi:Transposase DDE domain